MEGPAPPSSSSGPSPPHNTSPVSKVITDVKNIREDIIRALKTTGWPKGAVSQATAFADAIESGFTLEYPIRDGPESSDEVEASVRELRRIRTELEVKSELFNVTKQGLRIRMKRWWAKRFPGSIIELLRIRQAQVERCLADLDQRLRRVDPPKTAMRPSQGASPVVQPPAAVQISAASQPAPSDTPTPKEIPKRWEWLSGAKKGFQAVDTASGMIPVVGSYVGAVAKAGASIIEVIETMNENDEVAKKLGKRVCRLSGMLDQVKNTSKESNLNRDKVLVEINGLEAELHGVKAEVERFQSDGKIAKFLSSETNAGKLKELQENVQTALEETQLKATLAISVIVKEMKKDALLNCLGDGNYGARENLEGSATCQDGTRIALLEKLNLWIKGDTEMSDRILWITGMAGRGKSTVASTVASTWKDTPCAIFHFRRDDKSLDKRLICSLAKQLAKGGDPKIRDVILDAVRKNKDIASEESLQKQFSALLVDPLKEFKEKPVLIVVDALDECRTPRYAQDFITLLQRESSSFPVNVKFLITTRPDPLFVPWSQDPGSQVENLDSVPMEDVLKDIELYVNHGLSQIRLQYRLGVEWPPDGTAVKLATMSEGLFQWAQTILTYIGSRSPTTRLEDILDPSQTWSGLDSVYGQILSKAIEEFQGSPSKRELLFQVVETIVAAAEPVSLEVITFLHEGTTALKGKHPAKASSFLREEILADLSSLLLIPSIATTPVVLMHTSIRDFLVDQNRCTEQSLTFWVDLQSSHRKIAISCLRQLNHLLHQDMFNLQDSSHAFSEVRDDALCKISPGLRYCCLAWCFHLTGTGQLLVAGLEMSNELMINFKTYSTKKILPWLEVISAVGSLSQAIQMAIQAHRWSSTFTSESGMKSLTILWGDVQRFATAFGEPILFNPLQIYTSALAHCPVATELWTQYQTMAQIRTRRGLHGRRWSAAIWGKDAGNHTTDLAISPDGNLLGFGCGTNVVLWNAHTGSRVGEPLAGHTDAVTAVCFSPSGTLLASVSYDATIRLWDVQKGSLLSEFDLPLSSHDDTFSFDSFEVPRETCPRIHSLCFSPNGQLLAFGVQEDVVLWNTQTGTQGNGLGGHTGDVTSVCFSPDGKLLASGSEDSTIRLWEVDAGSQVDTGSQESGNLTDKTLTGHRSPILSVCFSPDGKRLASGSMDSTVRLWDTDTGSQDGQPLEYGKPGRLYSICFSPDGKLLATGYEGSICLWNVDTRYQVCEPLSGHLKTIRSICFFPDGKMLASNARDGTIRLWDVYAEGQEDERSSCHTDSVMSVCFSPDGKLAVSGSADRTIRLWDVHTGSQFGESLLGHDDSVSSVCFSPDGRLLASASDDKTIRLWDAHTGKQSRETLLGHTDLITSFCFSPNGELLASGSNDKTIRLWDVHTGKQLREPLLGHTSNVQSVSFSADGKLLASGSDDATIRLWDTDTGSEVRGPLLGHTDRITSICFSPDGKLIVSWSIEDATIRLWNAHTGSQVCEPLVRENDWVASVCISSDGKLLASESSEKTIRGRDAHDERRQGKHLSSPDNLVYSLRFSSDNRLVLETSPSGTITCDICSSRNLPGLSTAHRTVTYALGLEVKNPWISLHSRPLLWLPASYWTSWRKLPRCSLSHGKLAIIFDEEVCIFDVSALVSSDENLFSLDQKPFRFFEGDPFPSLEAYDANWGSFRSTDMLIEFPSDSSDSSSSVDS